uniref:Putative secreted peptide n=1 Tax=Anopheles braziliensis TaxID=58242 RepID=A0A2M3ZSM2_9DIPT
MLRAVVYLLRVRSRAVSAALRSRHLPAGPAGQPARHQCANAAKARTVVSGTNTHSTTDRLPFTRSHRYHHQAAAAATAAATVEI